MTSSSQKLLLLDTASLYFRAFFGVPDTLRAPDGTPVNALRGLLDFVARLVTDLEPDAVAACWDNDWRPQWRVDLLPSYKAHRVVEEVPGDTDVEEIPDPLEVQVPLIAEALTMLGIAVVGADEYEADDVIGTLATSWPGPVDIVTGDRDLFQLVDDERRVRVLYTARGVGRHEVVTDDVLVSKYGVHASQYVDFAILRGDPSDGLPGIAGIGDKTAAKLVAAYGDIEGIVAAAGDRRTDITPRVRKNLLLGGDYLAVAPKVVSVARDVDLPAADLDLQGLSEEQREQLAAFSKTWGLGGAEERITQALTR